MSEPLIGAWWFLRKHPYLRLRIQPAAGTPVGVVATRTAQTLDSAVSSGVVHEWRTTLYEPETTAFGGLDGIVIAHRLFHTDSQGVLTYDHAVASGTHELPAAKVASLIGLTHLLRAPRLEWIQFRPHLIDGYLTTTASTRRPHPEPQ